MKKRSLLLIVLAIIAFMFASCIELPDFSQGDKQTTNDKQTSDDDDDDESTTKKSGETSEDADDDESTTKKEDDTTTKEDDTTQNIIIEEFDGTKQIVPYIEFLRVTDISTDASTLKFNASDKSLEYDIRVSTKVITDDNFDNATKITDAKISGDSVVTAEIDGIGSDTTHYVAVRPSYQDRNGKIECIRVGGDEVLPIVYSAHSGANRVYAGDMQKDLSALFDEQTSAVPGSSMKRPVNQLQKIFTNGTATIRPIIDLEYMSYVSSVWLYYDTVGSIKIRVSAKAIDFLAEDSAWDAVYNISSGELTSKSWKEVEIGKEIRYIQILFDDGKAPVEVYVKGYNVGEGDPIATKSHPLPTMGELMGMCGFVAAGSGNTTIQQMSCVNYMREYHNFGWTYTMSSYLDKATNLMGSFMANFDAQYKAYTEAGLLVVPSIQWGQDKIARVYTSKTSSREATGNEKYDPSSYQVFADNMFQYAARYGTNNSSALLQIAQKYCNDAKVGLGYIKWLEFGNEPDYADENHTEYNTDMGYTAFQLAALQSAAYDGHMGTVTDPNGNSDHFGAVAADPNMKVAMAGLAGIQNNYISCMVYWMKANRTDNNIAIDAFNVHNYCQGTFMLNGEAITRGVSPEEGKLAESLSALVEFRNKYYPEKEVWLTEFGWDTGYSYMIRTACHAYGDYTSNEVQAMWLTRGFLILSTTGVDKAAMYMCEDATSNEEATGVYGTCGVYDINGKEKDSYYALYTLKNTLSDMTFVQQLSVGRDDVWVYQYADESGNVAYAVWCPTTSNKKVNDFVLPVVEGSKVTLVENEYGKIDGAKTTLTPSADNTVKIDVSENPVYVVVTK